MDIWAVLEYTIAVTIIGFLIWLIKLIFYDKLDARWHYFIWLVLLVRIVVPVHFRLIPTPLSIFQEIPIGKWMEMGRILAEKRGYGGLVWLLGRIYLWGAVLLGLFYLLLWAILRIRILLAPRADKAAQEYVDGIAAKYGLKSCGDIRIRKSSTPYICGVLHPILVLPEGNGVPEESVIVHELLHRKWKDVWVNIAVHAVRVLNWFNPAIWFLTSVVLNDSEALCDQRVLEYCGEENARDYGELLIAMGEGKNTLLTNPTRIGTSNMASSYRNMKTRIRRIRDFKRMPEKIGLVTFCITLMLALAGIGSSAEEDDSFTVPRIESEKDLEKALLYARCYHARTPEEAVYLFLRAFEERNTVYRMAVMPEGEIQGYEEFAREWLARTELLTFAELEKEGYPAYFPHETDSIADYRIYNLLYDEQEGNATVCAVPNGKRGEAYIEWKLELVKEDGWKVWFAGESERLKGTYRPEPLLSGSVQLGDFLLEAHGYNEGYFEQLGAMKSLFTYAGSGEKEAFPTYFSTEYKYRELFITYLGEKSLEESSIKIEARNLTDEGNSDEGSSGAVFDGDEWMNREPRLVYGEGTGYTQPGWCWKPDDKMGIQVQIYIDGRLAQEGEIWSGNP